MADVILLVLYTAMVSVVSIAAWTQKHKHEFKEWDDDLTKIKPR